MDKVFNIISLNCLSSNNTCTKPFVFFVLEFVTEILDNILLKQAHLRQLRKLERRLARKQKGSSNREKARIKVARMEQHIANSRKDWFEKETLRLVRNYNVIGIEDLMTKGLMRATKNARNYVDTSWGTFTTTLINKSKRYDCNVVKADRFFCKFKAMLCLWI